MFESSRRDLHNALLCIALKSYFSKKFARILSKIANFQFFKKFANFAEFNFNGILQNSATLLAKFQQKIEIAELCKEVHYVDLGESFQTHISNYFLAKIGFDTADNERLTRTI